MKKEKNKKNKKEKTILNIHFPTEIRVMSMELESFRDVRAIVEDEESCLCDRWTRYDASGDMDDVEITLEKAGKKTKVDVADCKVVRNKKIGDLPCYWEGMGMLGNEVQDDESNSTCEIEGEFDPSELVLRYNLVFNPVTGEWLRLFWGAKYKGVDIEEKVDMSFVAYGSPCTYLYDHGKMLPYGYSLEKDLEEEKNNWEEIARPTTNH